MSVRALLSLSASVANRLIVSPFHNESLITNVSKILFYHMTLEEIYCFEYDTTIILKSHS